MDNKNENRYVIIIAVMTQFIAAFVGNMLTIALKDIQHDLCMSITELNLLSIVYYIILISISIPLSKFISNYGIKRYFKINLVILAIGLVLSGLSVNSIMIIASRIIQGFSFAGLAVSLYVMVVKQIPDDRLGPVLGMVSSAGYLAMTSAPAIAGVIVSFLNWRFLFYISAVLCLVPIFMTGKVKTEWIDKKTINYKGSILYIFSMVLLVIGFFNLNMFWGLALIAVSQILLVILVKYEKNQQNKTFNFRLLKNRNYTIGNIAAFASYYITHVLTYIISLYLLYVVDIDASIGGLILLITPIVMVVTSPIAGQLTNRFDTRSLSAVAMTIILAVLIILIFIRTLPIELLIVAMILQGIGHGIFSPSNNKNVLTCVDDDDLADTSAFLSTSKDMGRTISIGVFNTICMVVGLNMDNPSLVGDNMLTVSEITIFISIFVAVISIVLLIYSKHAFEEKINLNILNFLKTMVKRS